jgi:hypothetical protein
VDVRVAEISDTAKVQITLLGEKAPGRQCMVQVTTMDGPLNGGGATSMGKKRAMSRIRDISLL